MVTDTVQQETSLEVPSFQYGKYDHLVVHFYDGEADAEVFATDESGNREYAFTVSCRSAYFLVDTMDAIDGVDSPYYNLSCEGPL